MAVSYCDLLWRMAGRSGFRLRRGEASLFPPYRKRDLKKKKIQSSNCFALSLNREKEPGRDELGGKGGVITFVFSITDLTNCMISHLCEFTLSNG